MLTVLRVSDHPAAVWAGAAEPWLRVHGGNWRERRVVLAPNAAWISALKAKALGAGLPILGIAWLTPGRFRAEALHALPGQARRVALREDLHLLLELAAAQLPKNPLARAFGPDPAPFQELLDTLEGAGWEAGVLPDGDAREVAAAAAQLRAKAGWMTTAAADRELREAAANHKMPERGKHLLAVGFGPGDWAMRGLLEAAAAAYAKTELVLDVLDYEQTAAAAWVGAWEEKMDGPADWLEAEAVRAPYAPLAAEIMTPVRAGTVPAKILVSGGSTPVMWLAENLQAEADLVVAQALEFLQLPDGVEARVGVVVGSVNSPLAREVAARLAALGLPHHDAPGHLPGRAGAQAGFEAWLDWQENGRLAGLVNWVRAAERAGILNEKDAAAVERILKSAAGATLADHPAVLAAWLDGCGAEAQAARDFCAQWARLPEAAAGAEYFQKILEVAKKLRWPEAPETLAERAEFLLAAQIVTMPRATILRWVRAVTRVPGRTRDELGREPWARLQIVDAASAAAQEWTHLVLGGLQHGEWPDDGRDSPLLDEGQARRLNGEVLREGPQGEGHWTVAAGRALLLSQADRRRLDRATFARLAALPERGLALTARLAEPADGRPARLSEYFWTVAKAVIGRLPSKEDWEALAEASRARRENFQKSLASEAPKAARAKEESAAAPGPEATARAYAARRDPASPFDEYSFCLRTPPATPLLLSCKKWQEAVERPGASWFKHLLEAAPRWNPAEEDWARMSLGTWAHEWVRFGPELSAGRGEVASLPLPNGETWRKIAAGRAREMRDNASRAFAAAGRALPEAWLDAFAAAAREVEHWLGALAENPAWPQGLAEINLPAGLTAILPGTEVEFPLRGRMDLVLFPQRTEFAPGKMANTAAWVIDFKTGKDKPLKLKALARGEGLQLALYAWALRAMGAPSVALTLLNSDTDGAPQLQGTDLADGKLADLWQLLATYAGEGRWGERNDLDDEHDRPGDYPSATLPVPVAVLWQKWEITHPDSK